MIISIDGPAGSGKSTAARKLAARLEIPYLDTGAMYRAIAYWAIREKVDASDSAALLALARRIRMDVDCGPNQTRVSIDGHDVTELIRGMDVSQVTSRVAKVQGIRQLLVQKQREIGDRLGSLITEGRDQGSVVFPHADVKFVLLADLDKRADRRLQEMQAEAEDVTLDQVRENLRSRDETDCIQWDPLLQPGAAIIIDTTPHTISQVIDLLQEYINNQEKSAKRSKNLHG